MGTQNGRFDSTRHLVDEKLDELKSSVHKFVDSVMTEPDGSPSDLRNWTMKVSELAKKHPYIAAGFGIGLGVGIGYALIRIARS
ncbi:MAG TPA: hypothetical protein VIV40_35530 [Kofleriaceae bacterium]